MDRGLASQGSDPPGSLFKTVIVTTASLHQILNLGFHLGSIASSCYAYGGVHRVTTLKSS